MKVAAIGQGIDAGCLADHYVRRSATGQVIKQ